MTRTKQTARSGSSKSSKGVEGSATVSKARGVRVTSNKTFQAFVQVQGNKKIVGTYSSFRIAQLASDLGYHRLKGERYGTAGMNLDSKQRKSLLSSPDGKMAPEKVAEVV